MGSEHQKPTGTGLEPWLLGAIYYIRSSLLRSRWDRSVLSWTFSRSDKWYEDVRGLISLPGPPLSLLTPHDRHPLNFQSNYFQFLNSPSFWCHLERRIFQCPAFPIRRMDIKCVGRTMEGNMSFLPTPGLLSGTYWVSGWPATSPQIETPQKLMVMLINSRGIAIRHFSRKGYWVSSGGWAGYERGLVS